MCPWPAGWLASKDSPTSVRCGTVVPAPMGGPSGKSGSPICVVAPLPEPLPSCGCAIMPVPALGCAISESAFALFCAGRGAPHLAQKRPPSGFGVWQARHCMGRRDAGVPSPPAQAGGGRPVRANWQDEGHRFPLRLTRSLQGARSPFPRAPGPGSICAPPTRKGLRCDGGLHVRQSPGGRRSRSRPITMKRLA